MQSDPFGYYQHLHEHQPVSRMPGTGFYVLTRYEDLREVLHDPETFSNTRTSGRCISRIRPRTPGTAACSAG